MTLIHSPVFPTDWEFAGRGFSKRPWRAVGSETVASFHLSVSTVRPTIRCVSCSNTWTISISSSTYTRTSTSGDANLYASFFVPAPRHINAWTKLLETARAVDCLHSRDVVHKNLKIVGSFLYPSFDNALTPHISPDKCHGRPQRASASGRIWVSPPPICYAGDGHRQVLPRCCPRTPR